MHKQFKKRILKKEELHNRKKIPSFKERDIYWCGLGENIGDEENGKSDFFSRPVLIIRKFNKNLFWGIPLTKQIKDSPYYTKITFKGLGQSAMITHLRLMDVKRLYGGAIGTLDKNDFQKVKDSIKNCL
jgi:mRNA interferase MazF